MTYLQNSLLNRFKSFTIAAMSLMYIFIGIKHFTDPQYFINIVPPQIPFKLFVVYFTGALELIGGVLIFKNKTRRAGAFLIIFLLIMVFPANIYLYVSETPQKLLGITKTDALIRLPFQIPLIVLAYWHSKKNHPKWVVYTSALVFIPTIIYFFTI